MTNSQVSGSRLFAALVAGAIAILLNTLALKVADFIPLATARGGLLRLMTLWLAGLLHAMGFASLWAKLGAPPPASPAFQTGFHLLVGIVMALLYGFVLERILSGPAWLKGLQYAALMWLINAVIILPATGEGFAGSAHLGVAGMVWFAAAHTLFFVAVALLFDRLRRHDKPQGGG